MPAPPNPTTGDLLKFRATAFTGQQRGECGCWFRVETVSGGGIGIVDLANLWQAVCDAQWPTILCPAAQGDTSIVELFNAATGRVTQSAEGSSTRPFGTVGTAQCPSQVAAVVKKVTGFAGRAFRGRVFFPFVPDDFIDFHGELEAAAALTYGVAYQAMFGPQAFTVGPATCLLTPVIVHTVTLTNPLPLNAVDIIAGQVTGKLGTQRKRGDYGIPNVP